MMSDIPANAVLDFYKIIKQPAKFSRFRPTSEDDQDLLFNIQKAMQEFYDAPLISCQYTIPVDIVRVGLLCVVLEKRSGRWKRAVVQKMEAKCPNFLLIDYGYETEESLAHAKLLNEDFVHPLPEYLQKYKSSIIRVPRTYDFKNNDFGDEYNLPSGIVEKGFSFADPPLLKQSKRAGFQNGKTCAVTVTVVDSPDSFYIRTCNYEERLDHLKVGMKSFYAKEGERYKVPFLWIVEDYCCAAKIKDEWFRVKVLTVITATIVKVKLVDSGITNFILTVDLFLLNAEFGKWPTLAAEARLWGVAPIGNIWTDDDVKQFRKLTDPNRIEQLMAHFLNAKDQDQLLCDLCSTTLSGDKWVTEMLIESGNAREADDCRLAVDGKAPV